MLLGSCSDDKDRLPSVLPDVMVALDGSDVGRAHMVIDEVVANKKAAPEEYALSAFTYLMTVNQSCPEATQALAQLRLTFNPSVDLFSTNGYFARAQRDGVGAAETWLGDHLESTNEGTVLSEDPSWQPILDAAVVASGCLDEAARRLELAFDSTDTPRALEVTLPKGLLYADEDILLQAPELKIMQGGLSFAATLVRMLDAFDWRQIFPSGENDDFFGDQVSDPAAETARLEALRDRRNASYLVVVPERDNRLKDAKAPLTQAWAHIQTGFDWGKETMTDGSGTFHMVQLTPRAAETVGSYVTMMGAALEGPAVDQFWPSLFNSYFDKRVFSIPGMLNEPAKVDIFEYSEADGQQLENATGVWTPLEGLLSRNWELR